jgi:hypothetical protein
MGIWGAHDRTKLWDEIDRLNEKVNFLLHKVKNLEMEMVKMKTK